jgi:hypothetical protein
VIIQDQQPEDPFSRDPHLTLAIYCVVISMFLMLIVMSEPLAEYHRKIRKKLDRGSDDPS